MENPNEDLAHFKSVIAYANSKTRIAAFKNTCFPCIERTQLDEPVEEKIEMAARYFNLED